MKKINLLLCGITLLSTSLMVSCKKDNNTSSTLEEMITIKDINNREVKVNPGSYSRIVCIGAGALRLYSYVGDVSLLSGVEDIDNYTSVNHPKMFDDVARPYYIANKEVFKNLPSCGKGGPMAQEAESEKILTCSSDLVISEYDGDKANSLQEQLGVPVVTVNIGSKGVFDDQVKNSINILGKVLGREERSKEINDYIASEKSAIQERVKDINKNEQKKAYICGLGNWGTTNQYMTAQNYEPFNVANINNVVTSLLNDGIQKIEEEKFISLQDDMDVIIIDAAAVKNILSTSTLEKTFSNTKAWKNNEVYLQMAYNAYYTNIEIALINTWFNAKVVYPSLFEDIDMVTKTNEVTKKFLGKELCEEIYQYKYSFKGYQKIDTSNPLTI